MPAILFLFILECAYLHSSTVIGPSQLSFSSSVKRGSFPARANVKKNGVELDDRTNKDFCNVQHILVEWHDRHEPLTHLIFAMQ